MTGNGVLIPNPEVHFMKIKRGQVYLTSLDPVVGSEQGGTRPVVVVQNDIGNYYSSTVVAAVTSKSKKPDLPTHVMIENNDGGLIKGGVILLDQIRTLDKSRLLDYIGTLNKETMDAVDRAFFVSIGVIMPNETIIHKTEDENNDDK